MFQYLQCVHFTHINAFTQEGARTDKLRTVQCIQKVYFSANSKLSEMRAPLKQKKSLCNYPGKGSQKAIVCIIMWLSNEEQREARTDQRVYSFRKAPHVSRASGNWNFIFERTLSDRTWALYRKIFTWNKIKRGRISPYFIQL